MSSIFNILSSIPLRRWSRFLQYGLSLLAPPAQAMTLPSLSINRPQTLGTTFSQLQCQYLGLDYQTVFRQICRLGFDQIRLCCYWHELEPQPNQFDFTTLDWLLQESERHQIDLILAVGMKVPRWPEFHFPEWLSNQYETGRGYAPLDQRSPAVADQTLRLIDAVVNHTRHAAGVKYWQVENEPFTQLEITGGRFLSYQFVEQEVNLVRQLALPNQKVLLTGSISLPFADAAADAAAFQQCLAMADAVGLNVYSKVPLGQTAYYLEPQPAFWQTLHTWQRQLALHHKEIWIAEAQAEPWEPNQLVATQGLFHPSSSPQQAIDLVQRLIAVGYPNILLWGCEYWYWQQQQGQSTWWAAIQQLIQAQPG